MLAATIIDYLAAHSTDSDAIALIGRIRKNQISGLAIDEAITAACADQTPTQAEKIKRRDKQEPLKTLTIRYQKHLRALLNAGHSYREIAKILAQKGVYNRAEGKAYSAMTICRAVRKLKKRANKNV